MNAAKKAYESVSNLEARDQEHLLLEQLPQVRYIARRIHDRLPSHIPFDDLVQAGILGLMEALHKFDPSKNVELEDVRETPDSRGDTRQLARPRLEPSSLAQESAPT